MARPQSAAEFDKKKIVAENRRARFDFAIEQVFEAGIALQGTEVKSLRFGEGTIAESYAGGEGKGGGVINSNIPEFSPRNPPNPETKRPPTLLPSGRQNKKMYPGGAAPGDARGHSRRVPRPAVRAANSTRDRAGVAPPRAAPRAANTRTAR